MKVNFDPHRPPPPPVLLPKRLFVGLASIFLVYVLAGLTAAAATISHGNNLSNGSQVNDGDVKDDSTKAMIDQGYDTSVGGEKENGVYDGVGYDDDGNEDEIQDVIGYDHDDDDDEEEDDDDDEEEDDENDELLTDTSAKVEQVSTPSLFNLPTFSEEVVADSNTGIIMASTPGLFNVPTANLHHDDIARIDDIPKSSPNDPILHDVQNSLELLKSRSKNWILMNIEERIDLVEYIVQDIEEKKRLLAEFEETFPVGEHPESHGAIRYALELLDTVSDHVPMVQQLKLVAKKSKEDKMDTDLHTVEHGGNGRSLSESFTSKLKRHERCTKNTAYDKEDQEQGEKMNQKIPHRDRSFTNNMSFHRPRLNPYKHRPTRLRETPHDSVFNIVGSGRGHRNRMLHEQFGQRSNTAANTGHRRADNDWPTPSPVEAPPTFAPDQAFIPNCKLLKDCVNKMSLYDLFVYYHSDDIDDEQGEVDSDDNRRTFDESDIVSKFTFVKDLASNLDPTSISQCEDLLREFHRNIEFGDVNNWEGASVSQVCLAEGTTVYVKLEEIAKVDGRVAGSVFQDIFVCSRKLHDARNNGDRMFNEDFVFENLQLPNGYIEEEGDEIDKHGQLRPDEYPFTFNRLSTINSIKFYAGDDCDDCYNFDSAGEGGCESRAESGNCDGIEERCKKEVTDFYNSAFLAASLNPDMQEVCYPKIFIKSEVTCENLATCGTECPQRCVQYTYSLAISEGDQMKSCYPFEVGEKTVDCGTWFEDQQVADSQPECTESSCTNLAEGSFCSQCLFAEIPENANIFAEVDFRDVDKAVELVFGAKASVGFICSLAESVADDMEPLPGSCCLDAPWENIGDSTFRYETWGQPFTCVDADDCIRPGPFFSGIDTEACSAYGGAWCPLPQNCTDLRDCVQKFIDEENQETLENRNIGYLQYLSNYPRITTLPTSDRSDTRHTRQCQRARQYFGFDPDFLNDDAICEDIEQFRLTDDFDFLNEFFNQGSDDGPGVCGGSASCLLKKPRMKSDFPEQVLKGLAWRQYIFTFAQLADGLDFALELLDFCPNEVEVAGTAAPNVACIVPKVALILLKFGFRLISEINDFTYNENAELSNIEPLEIYENTKVIFDNMEILLDSILDIEQMLVESSTSTTTENTAAFPSPGPTTPITSDGIPFRGCNRIDDDLDGEIDECDEDNSPPRLEAPEAWRTQSGGVDCGSPDETNKFCLDIYFKTIEEATAFVRRSLRVTDDCAQQQDLRIDVDVMEDDTSCDKTTLTASPVHSCSRNRDGNTYEVCGDPIIVELGVDGDDPMITCGFNLFPSEKTQTPDGTTVLFIDNRNDQFLNTAFSYVVEENCPENVMVEINVSTNEFTMDVQNLILMNTIKNSHRPDQVLLYVSNEVCTEDDKTLCRKDPDPEVSIRFYEIELAATDLAGNSDTAKCVVVVKPDDLMTDNTIELLEQYASSKTRYELASLVLNWDNTLGPPMVAAPVPIGVDEPPTVTCGFMMDVDPSSDPDRRRISDDKKTLVISSESTKFIDTGFNFEINDDCLEEVVASLTVTTNEVVYGGSVGEIVVVRTGSNDMSPTAKIFVAPQSCANGSQSGDTEICLTDPAVDFRFYEITVSAKRGDRPANSQSDVCRVIVETQTPFEEVVSSSSSGKGKEGRRSRRKLQQTEEVMMKGKGQGKGGKTDAPTEAPLTIEDLLQELMMSVVRYDVVASQEINLDIPILETFTRMPSSQPSTSVPSISPYPTATGKGKGKGNSLKL